MIIFTLHALERMRKRGITKSEVYSCIKNPDKIEALNDTVRAVKRIDNKVLVVIYRHEGGSVLVITAYKSSKVKKYLS